MATSETLVRLVVPIDGTRQPLGLLKQVSCDGEKAIVKIRDQYYIVPTEWLHLYDGHKRLLDKCYGKVEGSREKEPSNALATSGDQRARQSHYIRESARDQVRLDRWNPIGGKHA